MCEQAVCIVDAPSMDEPELGQVSADRVHQLGLLANREIPALVIDQCALAFGRLHRRRAGGTPSA